MSFFAIPSGMSLITYSRNSGLESSWYTTQVAILPSPSISVRVLKALAKITTTFYNKPYSQRTTRLGVIYPMVKWGDNAGTSVKYGAENPRREQGISPRYSPGETPRLRPSERRDATTSWGLAPTIFAACYKPEERPCSLLPLVRSSLQQHRCRIRLGFDGRNHAVKLG